MRVCARACVCVASSIDTMCVYTRSINGLKAQLTEAGEREEALRSDMLMSAAEKDVARAEGAAATRRVQQLEEQVVVTLNPKP